MDTDPSRQQILDAEHLRLLRIGFFVAAGANSIWIVFGLFYLTIGAVGSLAPLGSSDEPFPGFVFIAIGGVVVLVAGCLTAMKLMTAIAIGQRRWWIFCLVTALLTAPGFPWGTVLAAFTGLVLARPSIVAEFKHGD